MFSGKFLRSLNKNPRVITRFYAGGGGRELQFIDHELKRPILKIMKTLSTGEDQVDKGFKEIENLYRKKDTLRVEIGVQENLIEHKERELFALLNELPQYKSKMKSVREIICDMSEKIMPSSNY